MVPANNSQSKEGSIHSNTEMAAKRRKGSDQNEDEDDHINALPDSLIHYVFSFLPSIKYAIRTSVLSKRWRFLWTQSPNLIFNYRDDADVDKFADFVDKTLTLYSPSSKIEKFQIYFHPSQRRYIGLIRRVEKWLSFAANHEVKKLSLRVPMSSTMPLIIFNNQTLIKLRISSCYFATTYVQWKSLKFLSLDSVLLQMQMLEKVLSGAPMLESLELRYCYFSNLCEQIKIASNSLKKLVIDGIRWNGRNLRKKDYVYTISAPFLQTLEFLGHWLNTILFQFVDLSSLVNATLNFNIIVDKEGDHNSNAVIQLLEKLHYVKELTIGDQYLQVLSTLDIKKLPSPVSNCKCLTLHVFGFKRWHFPGIVNLLRNLPELENFIMIRKGNEEGKQFDIDQRSNSTSSNPTSQCSLTHLKTVEIIGFNANAAAEYNFLLPFVEYLLRNAGMLEKMTVNDHSPRCVPHIRDGLLDVEAKLSSFPRSSPHAVVVYYE